MEYTLSFPGVLLCVIVYLFLDPLSGLFFSFLLLRGLLVLLSDASLFLALVQSLLLLLLLLRRRFW